MKELWKTLRLASYVVLLPLVMTAAVSAYQWTQSQDTSVPARKASSGLSTSIASTRNHAIKLDRFGNFGGRIWAVNANFKTPIGAANLDVFLMQNGQVISTTKTAGAGDFNFSQPQAGVYSLIARGANGLSVHAIRIVDHDDPSVAESVPFETIAITQNAQQATNIIQSSIRQSQTEASNKGFPEGQFSILSGNQVRLGEAGDLSGQLHPSVELSVPLNSRVVLFQDGQMIADVRTKSDGSFLIPHLSPGRYDFVATGASGHAAFGFEALPAESPFRQTSFQDNGPGQVPGTLQTPLSSPLDSTPINQDDETFVVQDDGVPFFENGGGFINNSFGNSLGGPSTFGGVSPKFLGALSLTLAIIAIADDNNGTPPPPNSPIN